MEEKAQFPVDSNKEAKLRIFKSTWFISTVILFVISFLIDPGDPAEITGILYLIDIILFVIACTSIFKLLKFFQWKALFFLLFFLLTFFSGIGSIYLSAFIRKLISPV